MNSIKHHHCLISVYDKSGLLPIAEHLNQLGVALYSTGGTEKFLKENNLPCTAIEDVTGYPSILGGRVKTLHPKVFGGILARRNDIEDINQVSSYEIPLFDMVIVDLYPFEDTVKTAASHEEIIEKIDIGGVSLIRAAAKNYNDVLVISNKNQYATLLVHLKKHVNNTTLEQRKNYAQLAFSTTSNYDTAINYWMLNKEKNTEFDVKIAVAQTLRYGENPHQKAVFYLDATPPFTQLQGKELSYNNLVDVEAALHLCLELPRAPTFVIVKHTNSCGVATCNSVLSAWQAALAGDPTSAFGGVISCNTTIDKITAEAICLLFFEVLIAPYYTAEALDIFAKKNKRILLQSNASYSLQDVEYKSLLGGVLQQSRNNHKKSEYKLVTKNEIATAQIDDLHYAETVVKHLKSNGIALVKNKQLIGMGCGQTSRVDALTNAINKATVFGFDVRGSVMASEAFFPFSDCVEIAAKHGIQAIVQPGGSINDMLSIEKADALGVAMVFSGVRHFKH